MTWSNNVTFNFNILRITVTQILPKMVKIGPKCPFSSFLRMIFSVFVKTFFKTVDFQNGGHSLKLPVKKNFFCQAGLPGGPETAQICPKLQFCQDLHKFVGTFSINYLYTDFSIRICWKFDRLKQPQILGNLALQKNNISRTKAHIAKL